MGKKKTEKKVDVLEKSNTEKRIDRLEGCTSQDASAIMELHKRIDKIVIAHNKCKSLKGL